MTWRKTYNGIEPQRVNKWLASEGVCSRREAEALIADGKVRIDGAVHDVDSADTAWSYRDATWGSVFAGVDGDPAMCNALRKWTVDYFEALHPYSAGGAYVNMMMDEGQERVRASYRDNYDRLAKIKGQYDPENLFRVNQNIQPKG